MKSRRVFSVLLILAGLLLLRSVFGWAAPCTGMLKTEGGGFVHMACYYLRVPALVISVMWIGLSIEGYRNNNVMTIPLLLSGIMSIFVTLPDLGGIGVCANPEMGCHTTVWVIRILGIFVMLISLASMYDPKKQVRQL